MAQFVLLWFQCILKDPALGQHVVGRLVTRRICVVLTIIIIKL